MNDKSLKIKQILSFAFENHKKNNLKLAEQYYKKILKIDFPKLIDGKALNLDE